MEREYGIGRVPADVDQTEELLATIEILRRQPTQRVTNETPRCEMCGAPCQCLMWSNMNGRVCPDCYDSLPEG